jgi:hypothetical protein
MTGEGIESTCKVESKPIEEAQIIAGEITMSFVKNGGFKFKILKFDG